MKRTIAILIFVSLFISLNAQERIKMRQESGIYTIPCEVNGLRLRFIFDTGAADVSISSTEALFMLKNDYLKSENIIGKDKYVLADGSIEENTIIILEEIKIGTKILNNIKACVTTHTKAPLLLGQSAIKQLGPWYIEGDELVLGAFNESVDLNQIVETTPIEKCIEVACEYGNIGKYDICMELLKKACSQMNYTTYLACAKYISTEIPDKERNADKEQWIYELMCEAAKAKDQPIINFLKTSHQSLFYGTDHNVIGKYYRNLADNGMPYLSYAVWKIYEYKDETIAFTYLKKTAEAGNAEAQAELGAALDPVIAERFTHYSYKYVNRDYNQAVMWYKKAIEQGSDEAMYDYGRTLLWKKDGTASDRSLGLNYMIKSAEKGNSDAMEELVDIYYYDEYSLGKTDYDKALLWANKIVADKWTWNAYWAKSIIGLIKYERGEYEEAVANFKDIYDNFKSGLSPDPSCYIYYGDCCYSGYGMSPNYQLAIRNYLKYINDTSDDYFQDYAYYKLGLMYENGIGVNADLKKSFEYYREAANLGHAYAQCELGNIYAEGNSAVRQNVESAIFWYTKAADQKCRYGLYLLGFTYESSVYGHFNIGKAIDCYSKAIATEGDPDNILAECHYRLAAIYESGKGGTQKSYTKAGQHYKEAAKYGHANAQLKAKEYE